MPSQLIGELMDTAQANHCCGCGLKTRTPTDHNCPHGICAAASCTECGRTGIAEFFSAEYQAAAQAAHANRSTNTSNN
jgi:hypothetical protein